MTTLTTTPPDNRLAPGDGLIIALLMLSAFVVLLNEMMLGWRYHLRSIFLGAVLLVMVKPRPLA